MVYIITLFLWHESISSAGLGIAEAEVVFLRPCNCGIRLHCQLCSASGHEVQRSMHILRLPKFEIGQ